MRILVFSNFFPPEIGAAPRRLYGNATRWVAAGHSVRVVTNVPNSPFGKFYDGYENKLYQREAVDGIEVDRVWTLPAGKVHGRVRRAISFVANLLMSALVGLRGPKPDVVMSSVPYLTGVPAYIASRWHRAPLVYEMRDPWLQVAAEEGTLRRGSVALRLLSWLEQFLAARAASVVVIGGEMAAYMQRVMSLPETPAVVSNGIDVVPERPDPPGVPHQLSAASGRFIVGFLGNMGSQYDFEPWLSAAQALPEAWFFVLGEGRQCAAVKNEAAQRQLQNMHFFPPVASSGVDNWLRASDVTVVPMRPADVFEVYLPAKVLHSLSAEVPVLFGGSGEVSRLLRESGGGAVFDAGNGEQLRDLISERMMDPSIIDREGAAGRAYVVEHHDREVLAERFLAVFRGVGSDRSGAP